MKLTGIREQVFSDRYALKDGKGNPIEKTPEEMWKRVAKGVAEVEGKNSKTWEKKFYGAMEDFKYVPGGRILAGAGTGSKVTFYNCFVIPSPHDSRGGILETLSQMVEIMARGGGVGINLSSLRPRGAYVRKVNGHSSGPCNWAELFSVATKDIIQQGGTRRGALMLMLWDWHPDIEEFITVKRDLSRINGANLSVCVSDGFMKAVKENGEWELGFPDITDKDYDTLWDGDLQEWKKKGKKVKVVRKVSARKMWDLICEAAWTSAEPGVVFMERYNKWFNNWYWEKVNCVNPCVTGDTLVATENGWMQAKELTVGVKILTPKGLKPIDKVYNNGKQRIYEVSFSDGGNLKATADHKLRVVRNKKFTWIKVIDLKRGDQVVVVDRAVVPYSKKTLPQKALEYAEKNQLLLNGEYDRELGFLIGVTIGDGYFGQIGQRFGYRMKLCFSRQEERWGSVLVKALQKFGTNPQVVTVEHKVPYTDGTIGIHGSKQISLYKLANVLGLAGLIPKTGPNKSIPDGLFNLGEDFQKGLLDGLFSTDGSVSMKSHDPMLRLSSSSKVLLEQARLLLLNFGIHSRIYKVIRRRTTYDGREMVGTGKKYDLLIMNEGIARFYELIGLSHPEKAKRLESVAQQYYFMGGTNLSRVHEVKDTGKEEDVFDVHEPETLTWVTNGYVSLDCGEEGLPAWGVCNLGSLNLSQFVKDGKMDYKGLEETAKTAVRFQDDVVDADVYVFDEIKEVQLNGERRIGIGTMGLGDALIKMKLRYGSPDSLKVVDKIFRLIRDSVFEASVEIAREKGAFPKFDKEKYLQGYFIKKLSPGLRKKMKKWGIRNSILTQQAPTGSTSLLAGTSSGIEPVYEFSFVRRDRLGEHILYHPLFEAWKKDHPKDPIPDYFVSANNLTPQDHIKVQAAIQEYVDASISKTVNAPSTHTVEDVKKLYMLAYELGCKGVTYMREGSRPGVLERVKEEKKPVLSAGGEEKVEGNGKSMPEIKPRPMMVSGATYQIDTPVGTAFVTINTNGHNEPLEVFINVGKAGSDVAAMAEALGRVISLTLRVASPVSAKERVKQVFNQLIGIGGSKSMGFGDKRVRSLPDAVAKVLAMHFDFKLKNGQGAQINETTIKPVPVSVVTQQVLPVDAHSDFDLCPSCGEASLAYEEGCKKCYSCGYSEC
ncbi:hypothetical protein HY407_01405 [Candidatus Gottesmanbacteria bacterium]|nr:hypothetical protein [Candidatus Gottesmanbacteria bacterium]